MDFDSEVKRMALTMNDDERQVTLLLLEAFEQCRGNAARTAQLEAFAAHARGLSVAQVETWLFKWRLEDKLSKLDAPNLAIVEQWLDARLASYRA